MRHDKETRPLMRAVRHMGGVAVVAAALSWAAPGWGKDYCCPCENGEMISVDERNSMMASMKCSLLCKDATPAVTGQCKVAAAVPAPTQKASGAEAALFATEDCSGNASAVASSSNDLGPLAADGLYSFQVLSGGPASVWSATSFSGTRTQPVGPSLCVSPGWRIKSVKIGAD